MATKARRPGRVHRALRLQHHHHTGRKLAHQHTSYRALAVIMAFAALSMLGLNMMARATADSLSASGDLHVYARNPAPIPSTAATITSPADSSTTTHSGITVNGTCPVLTPGVIVVISDNGTEVGSAACSSGSFAIDIVLSPGQHVLIAKTYTITDDTGPDSSAVHIRYDAVAPPSKPSTTTPNGAPHPATPEPLEVTISHPFIVFGPAKDAIWTGTITGGTLPYSVHIDWGDGTTKTHSVTTEGEQSFSHHYTSMRPYDITFRVDSSDGQLITRHYAAVTPYVPPTGLLGSTPRPWGGSGPLGLYGTYLLLLAILGFVWYRRHPFAYAKVPVHHRSTPKKRKPGHR